MQKADALTRKSGSAKEGTESQFFPNGMLLTISMDEDDTADPDVAGINISLWESNPKGLRIPPNEAAIKGTLYACHDSGIAGHWGRYRTQE